MRDGVSGRETGTGFQVSPALPAVCGFKQGIVKFPVAAYIVSPLTAMSVILTPVGARMKSSVLGIAFSEDIDNTPADAGEANTIRLVSSMMAKPTPAILVNLLFIDL